MTGPEKTSKATQGAKKPTSATLRSTSGAGFEFEDLIGAWLLVKALSGEEAPGVHGFGVQLQAQVSTVGWRIDDLLFTAQANGSVRRLAISAKGNPQVTRNGLPTDFVLRAWEQWRDLQGPLDRNVDGLALVTLGSDRAFDAAWREVKNACTGSDGRLAISRIRSSQNQSRVFDSVQKPGGVSTASDEETIELIRRIHVFPLDLQSAHPDDKHQAVAQCRRLLVSGDAEGLWTALVNVASKVRIRSGTITIPELWAHLRRSFDLRHHPNFERDWETLSSITDDCKARIETELPSGYVLLRSEAKMTLRAALENNIVTVVYGDSGSGKSALVKSVLETAYPAWNQVWLGPEDLKTALSAALRDRLPLRQELSQVLKATVRPTNVLVLDSAERIDSSEFVVVRRLLQAVLSSEGGVEDGTWRVVVVTQPQSWTESGETILGGQKAGLVALDQLDGNDVKLALLPSPTLGWLAGHNDTIAALRNLRTLAWVVGAGAALGSSANRLASHTAIADMLWKYWTEGREDVQALVMRLAQREASFERSFALTELDAADTTIFAQRPPKLPLRKNERTNRIEFEHDLAADWARFQFLKQISTETLQWAALAENPLWTNALRMLGQFLVRQQGGSSTAWDLAFASAEAAGNDLAGNILLDALCLDPDAERLLTERVELLLANGAERFTRLLTRFHHIGTVPTSGSFGFGSALSIYIEAQFRSVIVARWPPVLRFLVGQRERLSGLVSAALAKVIHTWLTGMPRELGNGAAVAFRQELAEMALDMARTVQVEKGHGVMYLTREPLLYTAPLSGAADLPVGVGNWALELAGRRKADPVVTRRISEAERKKAATHAERLRTDADYRAQHEERRRIPRSVGSFRERLPAWPLGAKGSVDMDFRTACFKDGGLQSLMRARPEVAAEILLALIIEDDPHREFGSSRAEIDLGLDFPRDAYPTAFWKSPFFPFLQLAPVAAVGALIALVNFCTERWVSEVTAGKRAPPNVTLTFPDGSERVYLGRGQVFNWPQSDSMPHGNLYCALDALERWLIVLLDQDADIDTIIERILTEGNSAALLSVLVSVAKHRPLLLTKQLAPLLTNGDFLAWDDARVTRHASSFAGFAWVRAGDTVFNLARDWAFAPHRKKTLVDVAVDLLKADDVFARHLQALIPTWKLPGDPKESLERKLLFAKLNIDNYRLATDAASGDTIQHLQYPEELVLEAQVWQSAQSAPIEYLLLPRRCENRLQTAQDLADEEAEYLYKLLQRCESDTNVDDRAKSECRLASAATLIVLGAGWLERNSDAKRHVREILRDAITETPSTGEGIRAGRIRGVHEGLRFASYAAMHLWLLAGDTTLEWESNVLYLLTSCDRQAAATIVKIAYDNRDQLGPTWWRLLRIGIFWSGLLLLAPYEEDGHGFGLVWRRWLERLRRLPIRGWDATHDDLDLERVAIGCERLDFRRRMREYASGDKTWRGKPKRERGVLLDGGTLELLFAWLIDGQGSGSRPLDVSLALRLWNYDTVRARAHSSDKYGEYDLPSQNLGYGVLRRLAALSIAAPKEDQSAVWEPVFRHGPAAHSALHHFIETLFARLSEGDDPLAFEPVWRGIAEYGLSADWSQPGLWFHGERLICGLLGFGNEAALVRLAPDAVLRMRDVYERWAQNHLERDEESLTRFSYFLTTAFGGRIRLDGLRWIAASEAYDAWYREDTGKALIELVATSLKADAQSLSNDVETRQAIVKIAAALAARNIPEALALQERIKLLR